MCPSGKALIFRWLLNIVTSQQFLVVGFELNQSEAKVSCIPHPNTSKAFKALFVCFNLLPVYFRFQAMKSCLPGRSVHRSLKPSSSSFDAHLICMFFSLGRASLVSLLASPSHFVWQGLTLSFCVRHQQCSALST